MCWTCLPHRVHPSPMPCWWWSILIPSPRGRHFHRACTSVKRPRTSKPRAGRRCRCWWRTWNPRRLRPPSLPLRHLRTATGRCTCACIDPRPRKLQVDGTFDVAVKRGRTDPTRWLHEAAGVGDDVYVRVGGEFVVRDEEWTRPRLYVAGGIGLTPLLAMLRDTWSRTKGPADVCRSHLVYSASTVDELAFRGDLEAMQRKHAGLFECTMHVTDEVPWMDASSTPAPEVPGTKGEQGGSLQHGLVSQEDLHRVMERMHATPGTAQEPTAYVCGPPTMAEAMIKHLHELGLAHAHIRCERWW
mmetsp:Transcript_10555/g.64861  ORF Transcript_10555/g.64861 Transcript_10555/m.64861 type:complete len:301 (+) Transcript_10555:1745-2647(+)